MADMMDKDLDLKPANGDDGRDSFEQSPISDTNPHDLEKAQRFDYADAKGQSIIVDWYGDDDPERPPNFPFWRKFVATVTMAGLTMVVTFSSSVFSAATYQTSQQFHVSTEVMILGTSLFISGLGLGPTLFGPLSELYGRKIPLFSGFIVFAIFQIPVAVATNIQTVMVCRFFQGFFGSSCVAVPGGALADMWTPRERGFAMPAFAGSLFSGPVFGPIIGSYVSESYLRWPWTQWLTLIMAALFGVIAWICVPETYPPVLLSRRAKYLRHSTGNWALHAKHEESVVNLKEIANKYLLRPARMMILEPILALITLYLAFVYGVIYLFFEAYPISFQEDRGYSPGIASLPFISILIGVLAGCAFLAATINTKLSPDPKAGRFQETRLLIMIIASIVLPCGLFWYAWTSFPSINPWPQIIAGVPIGFGIVLITLQGMNYLIDTYAMYANSALAAMTLVRSFFGAGFPLFATGMFHNLGVQWATSVLAFIAAGLIIVPVMFYKYGAKIRSWSKYVPTP